MTETIKTVQDFPPIPAFAKHEEELKALWRRCRWMAVGVFVITGGVTGTLLLAGTDPRLVVAISTAVFQVILLSYGLGFFVPAFLTSLKRLGLSVHMMYESLRLGRESARDMKHAAGDMRRVRERVEKNSEPLPVTRRPILEDVEKNPNGED